MIKAFNTRPVLDAVGESLTLITMVGLTFASAATLAMPAPQHEAATEAVVHQLPRVEIVAQRTVVHVLPTVIVTAKRSSE
ncbi:hypothetical protein HNQ51_003141 [Inhella inkyongensis]|uniref:Uncharacterized protein n=1 Tax=Inhella inkyongensis TaxID=392593 RepID=A0A840SAJ9_9BURK|nr:hypothetical protein [Inhella inkyongensis]MBB5205814.1 hypothetical protein [Inhella inkyongensis]